MNSDKFQFKYLLITLHLSFSHKKNKNSKDSSIFYKTID